MLKKVIWLTGMSGVGKTTLSHSLFKVLKKKLYRVIQVDGDHFRKIKAYKNNFTKKTIILNNINIINYINNIKNNYDYILVSAISPILKTRLIAKKVFKENYFEVYVHCNLKILRKRDTKGLYKKADLKIINNLVGYKSKINYEKSNFKNISINTSKLKILECSKKILKQILKKPLFFDEKHEI